VKHWSCTHRRGDGVSCVCGVAMRENDTILIADACRNDSDAAELADPQYITYNDKDLPRDADITVTDSGRTFKVVPLHRPAAVLTLVKLRI